MSTVLQKSNRVHVGTQNLRPFQPGQCGNPNGRPRKRSVVEEMSIVLSQACKIKKPKYKDCDNLQAMTLRVVELALDEDTPPNVALGAIQFITERMDGKPKQQIDLTVNEVDAAELCKRAYKALYDGAIAQGLVIDEFTNNLILDGVEKIYPSAREVAPDLFANVGTESSGG